MCSWVWRRGASRKLDQNLRQTNGTLPSSGNICSCFHNPSFNRVSEMCQTKTNRVKDQLPGRHFFSSLARPSKGAFVLKDLSPKRQEIVQKQKAFTAERPTRRNRARGALKSQESRTHTVGRIHPFCSCEKLAFYNEYVCARALLYERVHSLARLLFPTLSFCCFSFVLRPCFFLLFFQG